MFSLRRYDWTLHIATILLCAFFLARAVTTYLAGALESLSATPFDVGAKETTPSAPAGEAAPSVEGEDGAALTGLDLYKVISERNIFNSGDTGVLKEEDVAGALTPDQLGELGPAMKTSLDIKVFSTLAVGDGTDNRSSAIVSSGKSKTPLSYFPGDEESFAPNVKLTKVARERIEFLNNGRLEFAELQDFAAKKNVFATADEVFGKDKGLKSSSGDKETASAEGGRVTIDQKDVDEALQNLDKLYSEVKIVPNYKDGKPSGMKVLSIKPGSLASKLGIRRGDILSRVNGQDLDMKRGMELFSSMKDSKNFSLDVERGGKNQTLEYEIR